MDEALDLAAAEHVLGTLDPAGRAVFLSRLARDPAAAAAVRAWAERLAPLHESLPELAPPSSLWPRIETALAPANDARAPRGVARGWRSAAIAASIVALVAAVAALRPGEPPASAIAALSATGGTPALLVTWHARTRRYEVQPVAMPALDGFAHELWLIDAGAPPRRLGLIAGHGWIADARAPGGAATIAVSIEPVGGSPTGQPTGPVVLSGKLVRMPGAA